MSDNDWGLLWLGPKLQTSTIPAIIWNLSKSDSHFRLARQHHERRQVRSLPTISFPIQQYISQSLDLSPCDAAAPVGFPHDYVPQLQTHMGATQQAALLRIRRMNRKVAAQNEDKIREHIAKRTGTAQFVELFVKSNEDGAKGRRLVEKIFSQTAKFTQLRTQILAHNAKFRELQAQVRRFMYKNQQLEATIRHHECAADVTETLRRINKRKHADASGEQPDDVGSNIL
jgi:hypothetical protein